MEVPIIGIVVTLIFSAFFSGLEIAYISSNRLKIELDKAKGTFNARLLGGFYKNESFFIAILLLGNNISLVFFGLFSAILLDPVIVGWGIENEGLILLIQTLMSTALVLIIAEFLPKAFVQINPNGYLKYSAYPMLIIFGILYVPTQVILVISNVALKLLRVDNDTTEKVFSKVDLEHYVTDLNERIHEEEELGNEMQILKNALDFDTLKARDCMVPRTDIIGVELDDPIDKLKHLFVDTGKSKIIVYRESIDNIIGYVHSFEMFKSPEAIKQILLPIQFVPEAKLGKELLELFAKVSGTMAVVVDEYGGTAGIVTIEDVIEEIFGEIEDEHDSEGLLEERVSETEFRFSARLEVDYLNDVYGFGFEEDEDYETLGGLVISKTQSIPDAGDRVDLEDYSLEVEAVSEHRIDVVRVRVK
ncbi:hemolysin family protein [Crocinitomicaceae bacterium]|nr:hemolysin family protein [Crocinitomicaceae bacterium]MDB3906075.1 hemolysin family protein [Crocinitomicaceae bacterium]